MLTVLLVQAQEQDSESDEDFESDDDEMEDMPKKGAKGTNKQRKE